MSEAGKTNNLAGQSRALTRVCDIVCNVQLFYSVLKAGRHAESTVEFRIRAPSHPAGSSPWAPRNIVPVALLAYSHLPMQPCRALRPSDLSSRGAHRFRSVRTERETPWPTAWGSPQQTALRTAQIAGLERGAVPSPCSEVKTICKINANYSLFHSRYTLHR